MLLMNIYEGNEVLVKLIFLLLGSWMWNEISFNSFVSI